MELSPWGEHRNHIATLRTPTPGEAETRAGSKVEDPCSTSPCSNGQKAGLSPIQQAGSLQTIPSACLLSCYRCHTGSTGLVLWWCLKVSRISPAARYFPLCCLPHLEAVSPGPVPSTLPLKARHPASGLPNVPQVWVIQTPAPRAITLCPPAMPLPNSVPPISALICGPQAHHPWTDTLHRPQHLSLNLYHIYLGLHVSVSPRALCWPESRLPSSCPPHLCHPTLKGVLLISVSLSICPKPVSCEDSQKICAPCPHLSSSWGSPGLTQVSS